MTEWEWEWEWEGSEFVQHPPVRPPVCPPPMHPHLYPADFPPPFPLPPVRLRLCAPGDAADGRQQNIFEGDELPRHAGEMLTQNQDLNGPHTHRR